MTPRILRTIFLVSVFAYIGFAWLDYREPGIVSDVMSVHLWLVPIIASGVLWSMAEGKVKSEKRKVSVLWVAAAAIIGIVFGAILWQNGSMFGDFRLLMTFSGVLLPFLGLAALRD